MRGSADSESAPPVRVLIVRLTALGDVILVTHLAHALRAARPGLAVDLLTDARIVPLLERLGGFDRVIGWDRRGDDAGLGGVLRVRRRVLEGASYAAVVDLQNKLRTRALTAVLGAPHSATLRKRGFAGTVRALLGRDRPIHDRHTLEMYAEAARAAGLEVRAVLALGAGSGDLAPSRPGATPDSAGPLIGLGAGTTHATKRWPHFAALARELAASHPQARFAVIGGPADRADLDAIRAEVPPERLDPRDTAALDPVGLHDLLRELDLLVTVDSGAAHLAQASGVPTLVLFGPTSPVRWGPHRAPHRALSLALPCAPCSNTGGPICPRPDHAHACMRDLTATTVAEAARASLAERAEASP